MSEAAATTITRSRRSQAERTAESDARMLEAAVTLICERGTEGMTLKDVGVEAGYSRGLAGYRFGSKAGLLGFVVKTVGEAWLRELKAVTAGRVGLDAIGAALDAHQHFVADAPQQVRAFYLLWFEATGPRSELREVIERIHRRRYRDVLGWIEGGIATGTVAEGVAAEAVAEHFCAVINGIVYQWLVRPEPPTAIAAMHDTLKSTMYGLLPVPQGAARARSKP